MKRFTATEKWDKSWYQELSILEKLFWNFLCDNCDLAGVWEPNFKQASFQMGAKVSPETMKAFSGKIALLKNGKYWITSFVEFQYGKLSKDCRPHVRIFALIEKHGLDNKENLTQCDSVSDRVSNTLQDKDKEKDKDKDLDKEGDARGAGKAKSVDEVKSYCIELGLPESDGIWFWDKCLGCGWTNAGKAIRDWRATVRAWKTGNYFPSLKSTSKLHLNGKTNGTSQVDKIALGKELDRINSGISEIRQRYGGHQTWDDLDVFRKQEMESRKKEIMGTLGLVY